MIAAVTKVNTIVKGDRAEIITHTKWGVLGRGPFLHPPLLIRSDSGLGGGVIVSYCVQLAKVN